jgi:hypothetical protein
MEIDNTIDVTKNQIRDLLIYYATKYKDAEFYEFYKILYPDATNHECARIAYFIRLALGINPDNRNIY